MQNLVAYRVYRKEVIQVSNDFSDTSVPFGCLTALWKTSKGEKVNLVSFLNFKDIKPNKITGKSNFCESLICETT